MHYFLKYFSLLLIFFALFSCKKDDTIIPTVKLTFLSSPVSCSINKICFLNSFVGFAICENGKLFKTTDGGNTWSNVLSLPSTTERLTDIRFFNGTIGYILGGKEIYKTTDGGTTWSTLPTGVIGPNVMSFVNANIGYTAGGNYIYKTTNGGTTWNKVGSPGIYDFSIMTFTTKDTGIVTDMHYRKAFITTNGGSTWSETYYILANANSINFITKQIGYAVCEGYVYRTGNMGISWDNAEGFSSETEFALSAIGFNSSVGVIVGNESVIVSDDNGFTWEYRFSQTGENVSDWLTDVFVIDSKTAIASSKSGAIYKIELGDK